jgi:hypothetical protein
VFIREALINSSKTAYTSNAPRVISSGTFPTPNLGKTLEVRLFSSENKDHESNAWWRRVYVISQSAQVCRTGVRQVIGGRETVNVSRRPSSEAKRRTFRSGNARSGISVEHDRVRQPQRRFDARGNQTLAGLAAGCARDEPKASEKAANSEWKSHSYSSEWSSNRSAAGRINRHWSPNSEHAGTGGDTGSGINKPPISHPSAIVRLLDTSA